MRVTLSTTTPAELSLPEGTPTRGLVLRPDIVGLRPLFDDLGARLAAEHGWAVCAPEPFPGREDLPIPDRMAAMAGVDRRRPPGPARRRGRPARGAGHRPHRRARLLHGRHVRAQGAALGGTPVAGRFDRAVSFYGMIRVPEAWRGPGQRDAIDLIRDEGACPVLAVVGTLDPFMPPVDVADLEATGATVLRYEGAEHGFVHDASRPAHRPDDAADAWRRVVRRRSLPV